MYFKQLKKKRERLGECKDGMQHGIKESTCITTNVRNNLVEEGRGEVLTHGTSGTSGVCKATGKIALQGTALQLMKPTPRETGVS